MNKTVLFIGTPGILLYSQSIKNIFQQLGFKVFEPEYPVFKDQNRLSKHFFRKQFLNNFFAKQNKLYIKAAQDCKPDFVFVINHSRITPLFLEYCKQNNIPVFLYRIDSIRWCDKAIEQMHFYKDIFSYEPSDCQIEFRSGKYVKFLPLGYDPAIYFPANKVPDYKYDLCFVGRLEKRRLEILEQISKYAFKNKLSFIVYTSIQLRTITSIWLAPKLLVRRLKFALKYKYLNKFIINKPIIGNELTELYHQSKICLNIHVGTHPGMHTGPNPRTFELLGCQAFQLIDKGHLDATLLTSPQNLVEFNDIDTAIDKIHYYLNHEQERRQIAKAGNELVAGKYTLYNLIKTELEKSHLL